MLKKKPTKAYWGAYNALYGEGSNSERQKELNIPTDLKIAPKRKKPTHEEFNEQVKFCVWLDKTGIIYYAIPNGGKRNMAEAYNLKRSGVKAGVPDICIPESRKGYHGLYIELKRLDGGKLSDEQKRWINKLNAAGNLALVANGCEEAKKIVNDYFFSETRCST